MKWSLKIAQVAGIGIFVHWTFLILIGWVLYVHWRPGAAWPVALEGVGFVLAVFACIVLHELGHALTARRYGIGTRDITLLPIGGVARLERIPEEPRQELWIALAGPAVNVAIAALLGTVLALVSRVPQIGELVATGGQFLWKLFAVNILLVVFNLIPAFPMDGGRVLRAALATRLDYVRATQIAATTGQLIAIGFGLLGLFFNPFLLFIALFVYLGAQHEAHFASVRAMLRGIPVRDAMITRFRTLEPGNTVLDAVALLRTGAQQDFPVEEDGAVIGLLTREALLAALADGRGEAPVIEAMRRDCPVVEANDLLEDTLDRMRQDGCSSLAVVRGGTLVGLLTLENVGEFMMVNAALRRVRSRGGVHDIFGPA